jgi:inhibitor of KinA
MQIRNCGENAVILSVSYDKTKDAAAGVRKILGFIRENPHPAILSVRPGLDCILIEYSSPEIKKWLENISEMKFAGKKADETSAVQEVEVPICYDFGEDLPRISAVTGLKSEEIIRIHGSATYEVWMLGFMPGFPYLGELPADLQIHRKDTPNTAIPAGSVAIAEEYVGIYPFQSPGGWHVIGRTPLRIFDYQKPTPALFDYGMKVKFIPITTSEFERMQNETTCD